MYFMYVRIYPVLCLVGGFLAPQVMDAVVTLNNVCMYSMTCPHDTTHLLLPPNILLQLAKALRKQRQSKGTLRLDQVFAWMYVHEIRY